MSTENENGQIESKEIKKLRTRLMKKQVEIEQANKMYHLATQLHGKADEILKQNVVMQARYTDALAEIQRLQEQTKRIQQNYTSLLQFRHADTLKHYKDLCEEIKPFLKQNGISDQLGEQIINLFGKGFFQMEVYELQTRMTNVETGEPLAKEETETAA